jgi:glucan phosphoethanolaminetransferase (alkaline phosphatase superfamily)
MLFNKIAKGTKRFYYVYSIFLILIICLSDTLSMILYEDYYYAKVVFLASLAFILLPLYLFKSNLKLYFIYLLFPILLLFIKFACYFLYKAPFDENAMLMIINTNLEEAKELIKDDFLIISLCLILYSFLIYIIIVNRPAQIPGRLAKYVSISALIVILILPLVFPYPGDSFSQGYKREAIGSYPASYLNLAKHIYSQYELMFSTKNDRKNFTFSAHQDTSTAGQQVHVLIIGESSRYDNWGINGYSRNTSPRLNKRADLISFNNATAGGYITEFAVPLLLTGVGAEHYDLHYKQKSIVGAFNESGFKSYWISDQTDRGGILIHSSEANNRFFYLGLDKAFGIAEKDEGSKAKIFNTRDIVLVDKLKEILKQPGNKKFIVLHTLGSHYNYNARYPDNFDIYKPSYKSVASLPKNRAFRNVLINTYDNTIRYSDMVIDSVISLVSKLNEFSSVTYMSDHGEDLLDDNRDLCYHGNPIPTKYVARVPFFIWYSPQLEKKFPENINNLYKNKNSKISSEDLIYTLTDLVGIHYPKQDSSKNIAGPYFNPKDQLIMGDKKIYNVSSLK